MPTFGTDERHAAFIDSPEKAHVPGEVFAHRPQDARGPVVHVYRFAQRVGHGEPHVTLLFSSLLLGNIPQVCREQGRAVRRDASDRQFDRKLRPVRPKGRELQPSTENGTLTRGKIVNHALAMTFSLR